MFYEDALPPSRLDQLVKKYGEEILKLTDEQLFGLWQEANHLAEINYCEYWAALASDWKELYEIVSKKESLLEWRNKYKRKFGKWPTELEMREFFYRKAACEEQKRLYEWLKFR